MKFLIAILAVRTVISLGANKRKAKIDKPETVKRVEHPAEMQLR
jgi:hypothetical protein